MNVSIPSSPLPASDPGLSPRDVRYQEFPSRLQGLDRASVRAFLGRVADGLENLLKERQALQGRLAALEAELESRREAEDAIRRAVVAAEHMGRDLREAAQREGEALIEQAQARREAVDREGEARAAELTALHRARLSELEDEFRGRRSELEREHHVLTLERDRAHAERTVYLERAYSERHADLTARLSAARGEYLQFVAQYRALVHAFAEMSTRHLPHVDDPALPAGAPLDLHARAVPLPGEHETAHESRSEVQPAEVQPSP
ncbi:DivIVA domain-containing protein [Deinococcus aestuarii]|uniref:DivIVA domain-containing protein n=1 Tax=Deinococcus aestuarii TaxID=2774531 RepID=UPI001C0E6487|nr:DivIVA domain-containing protein [Deinococcus aestuarii]